MNPGRVTRAVAALLIALTAGLGAALAGNQAAAQTVPPSNPPSIEPIPAAAGWLASRFVDGTHLETVFGGDSFPDQGLTADAVLALDGADLGQDFAAAATAWLADPANLAPYIGDGTVESYAGALAKSALVAVAQGADPTAFGGVDLIDRLQARQAESGRYVDASEFGDFSNGITQSLAVVSLLRADADASDGADYLASSQCDDGGFPLQFEQATCVSQVDATGFAIQALLAAGRTGEATAGLDYLESVQHPGGGFGDSGLGGAPNANSTGLAAQALRVGEREDAADSAVDYLLGLQVGCDGPAELRGAIRFDEAGGGDTQRATAQALAGLTGAGLFEIDNVGDAGPAPGPDCDGPTSSPAPTSSSTASSVPSPTTSAAPAPVTSTTVQGGPVPGGSGDLARTGAGLVPPAVVGVLFVLVGVLLMVLARQRRGSFGGVVVLVRGILRGDRR